MADAETQKNGDARGTAVWYSVELKKGEEFRSRKLFRVAAVYTGMGDAVYFAAVKAEIGQFAVG